MFSKSAARTTLGYLTQLLRTKTRYSLLMQRLSLTIARFALSAGIGGAMLFVVKSVREATSPAFDSVIKNELAALRFPPYYLFGFVLVGLGLICGAAAVRRQEHRQRWRLLIGVLCLAL